jgi:3-deoxy-7-phosphoheptulonate synthase/chorismate mutase
MEVIKSYRKKINHIDNQIVELLISRNKISQEIIDYKEDHGISVYDYERESDIIISLKNKFSGLINPSEIEMLFKDILFYSKQYHLKLESSNLELDEILNQKPFLIAGPCSIESEDQIFRIANDMKNFGIKLLRGGAFKPRTSPSSFQGLGFNGLKLIKSAAEKFDLFVVSEFTSISQLDAGIDFVDIVQIGSRNMFSYDLLKEIGKITADKKKPIILKRGFNATLREFLFAAEYIMNEGNPNVIMCLRGIRTFEQIDSKFRFTSDLASIIELKFQTNLKVIFDPSHAIGDSNFIYPIAKSALALGADGIMVETHFSPELAFSDSKQTIDYETLNRIIEFIEKIKNVI